MFLESYLLHRLYFVVEVHRVWLQSLHRLKALSVIHHFFFFFFFLFVAFLSALELSWLWLSVFLFGSILFQSSLPFLPSRWGCLLSLCFFILSFNSGIGFLFGMWENPVGKFWAAFLWSTDILLMAEYQYCTPYRILVSDAYFSIEKNQIQNLYIHWFFISR